jgi:hypothetical protein
MAWIQKEFDTYKLWQAPGSSPVTVAAIDCFKAGIRVGGILFYEDNIPLPSNENHAILGIRLYWHASRFKEVVDTVRYEKPLYLMFESNSLGGWLTTSDTEPVGEEE